MVVRVLAVSALLGFWLNTSFLLASEQPARDPIESPKSQDGRADDRRPGRLVPDGCAGGSS